MVKRYLTEKKNPALRNQRENFAQNFKMVEKKVELKVLFFFFFSFFEKRKDSSSVTSKINQSQSSLTLFGLFNHVEDHVAIVYFLKWHLIGQ